MSLNSAQARARLIEDNEIPPLPDDWDVQRFRFLFREIKERNGSEPVGDMLSVSGYQGVVPKRYEHEEQRRTNKELQTYRVVRPGQLAVNTMWLNHLGLGISEYLGHVSPAYAVYDISKELNRRFIHHLFRSQYYLKIYLRYLYGIRPNSFQIKTDDWNSMPVIVPPIETQKAIADFLDRETTRIDQLIEKKQRLVELLGEKTDQQISILLKGRTQSLLSQSLRWLVRVQSGDFISNHEIDKQRTEVDPIPVVGGNGVMAYANKSNSPEQTIVVGRVGALCGNVHFIKEKSWVTDNALIVRVISKSVEPAYLVELLRVANLNEKASKSAQPLITSDTVKSLKVRIPNREAQIGLCDQIVRITNESQSLSELVQNSLKLIQELRATLITAAVTGQLDVTTWRKQESTDRHLDNIEETMQT